MQTYLVRAALERSVPSVERGLQGLRTPMVGRSTELQRLRGAVARAHQTRQLQALTLVGDAGLGKSRLLREFTAALIAQQKTQPQDCRVLTLRLQPDGCCGCWACCAPCWPRSSAWPTPTAQKSPAARWSKA